MTDQLALLDEADEKAAVCWIVAHDPANQPSVDAIVEAVRTVAYRGRISRNDVAPLLPAWVAPKVIGATYNTLIAKRVLVPVPDLYVRSKDAKGRNSGRPMQVYDVHVERLVAV